MGHTNILTASLLKSFFLGGPRVYALRDHDHLATTRDFWKKPQMTDSITGDLIRLEGSSGS